MTTLTASHTQVTPLVQGFMQDHQQLTRGLARLAAAVEQNAAVGAREIADEIDRNAGGHMEFEERILYPSVAAIFGSDYAAQLYEEHQAGLSVVRRIAGLREEEWFSPTERETLLDDVRAICAHVLSCGTLLSVLADLSEPEQAHLLDQLQQYRAAAPRWSQLPAHLASNTEARPT